MEDLTKGDSSGFFKIKDHISSNALSEIKDELLRIGISLK